MDTQLMLANESSRSETLMVFLPGAFLRPEDFEREGFVPNVVFPTGIVTQDDSALVYYGAADTFVGVVEFSLGEMLSRVRTRAARA